MRDFISGFWLIFYLAIYLPVSAQCCVDNNLGGFTRECLIRKNIGIKTEDNVSSNSVYFNNSFSEEDEEKKKLIMSCGVLCMAGGYYSYNKNHIADGNVLTFGGSFILFGELADQWSRTKGNIRDKRKLIWHLIGIPIAWTVGMNYCATSEPDNILGGSLTVFGLLLIDYIAAELVLNNI